MNDKIKVLQVFTFEDMAYRSKIAPCLTKIVAIARTQRYHCNLRNGSLLARTLIPTSESARLRVPCNLSNQQRRNLAQEPGAESWLTVDTPPVSYAYNMLTAVHDNLGVPWWASVVLSTFALRTCFTLPMFVLTAKNNARLELLAPEVKKLAEDLRVEVTHAKNRYHWSDQTAMVHFKKNLKRHLAKLYVRDNCHPGKNLILPWIQIPIWLSMSFALRNMSGMTTGNVLHPELAYEGVLWFQNLLLPDQVGLPLIFCTTNIAVMEMYNLRATNPTKFKKRLINFMRAFNVILFPIAATCPSGLTLYWASSSTYGLIQNLAVSLPRVRRFLGIEKTPKESSTPFKDNWNSLKVKFTEQSPHK